MGTGGGHVLIALAAGQGQRAFPEQFAGILGDPADILAVQRVGDAALQDLLQQIAVVDAQHPHPRLLQIDADQRQLLAAGLGQHVGRTAKAQRGLAVLDLGGEVLRGAGFLARRRRNAGARLDRVALAVADALHAQLLVVGGRPPAGWPVRSPDSPRNEPVGPWRGHRKTGGRFSGRRCRIRPRPP